jgi:AI-2 transport protein TqsA
MRRVTAIRSAPSGSSWQEWCRLGRSPATVDPNVPTQSPVVWPGQERDGRRKSVFGFAVLDVNRPGDHRGPPIRTWGVLAFVTNYIPNIGFILGVIPPALIALPDGGVGSAVAVVVAYTVINVVVQTIIQPRFTGDAVGISATVAFVSLIFWAYVLGTLGALLAVPATLFLKSVLLVNSVPASWVNALVSASPSKEKPRAVRRIGRQAAAESS